MLTRVVNLRREACDVYCGRGTPYGNPYITGRHGSRRVVIEKHRRKVLADAAFVARIKQELTGKRLGCPGNCVGHGLACHCDVYVEICNGMR